MKHLTDRQREVLDFIIDFRDEHSYYPPYREIAEGVGCTVGRAFQHVENLVKKGHIKKTAGRMRFYQMLEKPRTVVIGGRRVDVGFTHKGKVITEVR